MLLNYLFQFMEATNKDTACIIKQNLARWVWWVKWVWEPGEPYLKLGFSCISPLLLFSLGCCWEAKYVISSSHQLLPSFRWRTAAESTCVELKYHQKGRKKESEKLCLFSENLNYHVDKNLKPGECCHCWEGVILLPHYSTRGTCNWTKY